MPFDEERRGIVSDLNRLKIENKIIKFLDISYVGVGGEPYVFVFPKNIDELKKLIEYVSSKEIPFWVIGNSTKLLVRDGKIPKIAISLAKFDKQELYDKKDRFVLKVGAGTSLSYVIACGIKNGFQSVEVISGIPGTVGGAVKKNAGTKFGSISEFLEEVDVLSASNGNFEIKTKKPCFGYRTSDISDSDIVVSATLSFKKAKPSEVKEKVSAYLKRRYQTQPINTKNFGCIFLNPSESEPAGKIIDELGLKGFRISKRVKISNIHANFIENEGGASFAEVLQLINEVKERVKNERNIELKEEVVILNDENGYSRS